MVLRKSVRIRLRIIVMNKHFQKVLKKLKTSKDVKALGFSRSEIKGIAAKIADNLDVEDNASDEDVDGAIDEAIEKATELLKYGQISAQRTIAKYRQEHDQDEDDDDDDEPDDSANGDDDPDGDEGKAGRKKNGQQRRAKSKKENDDDKDATPAWAKSLADSVNKLSDEVSRLKQGNVSNGRRAKLQAILKDTGKFGERRLREFDRIASTFKSEDDFQDYLDEVTEDLESYNQERADAGLKKLGPSEAGTAGTHKKDDSDGDDKPKQLTDKELDDLADQF